MASLQKHEQMHNAQYSVLVKDFLRGAIADKM
jgi:hypothetical protein